MIGKTGALIAVGAGLVAAAGMGWWFASQSRTEPATVIVLPPPPPPSAALPVTPVVEEMAVVQPAAKPARPVAVRRRALRTADPPPAVKLAAAVVDPPSIPVRSSTFQKPVPLPEPRMPRMAMLPVGTLITVRLNHELRSDQVAEGERFTATLDQPIVIDGLVIAERGSEQVGRIVALDQAGRVKGRSNLALMLTEITTADGQRVGISTDSFTQEGESNVKGDLMKTGVGAALGATIGAIAGGGKGAAIGAAVGGAAGAGTAMVKKGAPARLEAETRISFRLNKPVHLTERID